MKILDTNILIYTNQTEYAHLRNLFIEPNVFVSDITRIETLGFHRITEPEKEFFEDVFNVIPSIPFSEKIIQKAIDLRQGKKYSLGDAIIAATALIENLILVTANEKDFKNIHGLTIENPIT